MNATHTPSDHVDSYAAVGELVEYVILVTNIGNVDLTEVAVTGSLFEGGVKRAVGRLSRRHAVLHSLKIPGS